MELKQTDNPLWVERFRPQRIQDCILPAGIKSTFQQYVDNRSVPNLLLAGKAGTGKTTIARALCEELDYDYIIINGSNEGRLIDTLRTRITQFASSVSFGSDRKVIILDEADYLPADTIQPALRAFVEEFSGNCGFILTCNFKNRLIEPIHSRCSVVDFQFGEDEKQKLMMQMLKRAVFILQKENVQFDKAVIAQLVQKFCPDWRRFLNELQRYAASGNIDSSILAQVSTSDADSLIEFMKKNDFASVRKWVYTNPSLDLATLVRELDDRLYEVAKTGSIPQAVLIFADYQNKHVTAMDPAINCLAMFVELMASVEFK